MHEDELSAFKTASSTTQDVKELLISVQSATSSLKEIAQRVEDSNSRASNHAELFSEMTKLKTAIQMERRNFEMEREKMIQMVNEMAKFTREQKEVSNNERLRIESKKLKNFDRKNFRSRRWTNYRFFSFSKFVDSNLDLTLNYSESKQSVVC